MVQKPASTSSSEGCSSNVPSDTSLTNSARSSVLRSACGGRTRAINRRRHSIDASLWDVKRAITRSVLDSRTSGSDSKAAARSVFSFSVSSHETQCPVRSSKSNQARELATARQMWSPSVGSSCSTICHSALDGSGNDRSQSSTRILMCGRMPLDASNSRNVRR